MLDVRLRRRHGSQASKARLHMRTASETSKPWEEAVSAARAHRDDLPALSGHLRSLRLAGARRGKSEGSDSGVRPNAGHGSGDAAVCR